MHRVVIIAVALVLAAGCSRDVTLASSNSSGSTASPAPTLPGDCFRVTGHELGSVRYHVVPTLKGTNLQLAREILRQVGFANVTVQDWTGDHRSLGDEHDWFVARQHSTPHNVNDVAPDDVAVTLYVQKYTDSCTPLPSPPESQAPTDS